MEKEASKINQQINGKVEKQALQKENREFHLVLSKPTSKLQLAKVSKTHSQVSFHLNQRTKRSFRLMQHTFSQIALKVQDLWLLFTRNPYDQDSLRRGSHIDKHIRCMVFGNSWRKRQQDQLKDRFTKILRSLDVYPIRIRWIQDLHKLQIRKQDIRDL